MHEIERMKGDERVETYPHFLVFKKLENHIAKIFKIDFFFML